MTNPRATSCQQQAEISAALDRLHRSAEARRRKRRNERFACILGVILLLCIIVTNILVWWFGLDIMPPR